MTANCISIIVAMTPENVIGKNNALLWHLPADMKHFRQLTTGHCIVMGRKTFDSIGRPLPNRTNIVITRNQTWQYEGCIIANSLEDALIIAKKEEQNQEIFIIGGGNIYKQALPLADKIYLTIVETEIQGDTFFPEIDLEQWQEISHKKHTKDDKNLFDYSFITLQRYTPV